MKVLGRNAESGTGLSTKSLAKPFWCSRPRAPSDHPCAKTPPHPHARKNSRST